MLHDLTYSIYPFIVPLFLVRAYIAWSYRMRRHVKNYVENIMKILFNQPSASEFVATSSTVFTTAQSYKRNLTSSLKPLHVHNDIIYQSLIAFTVKSILFLERFNQHMSLGRLFVRLGGCGAVVHRCRRTPESGLRLRCLRENGVRLWPEDYSIRKAY